MDYAPLMLKKRARLEEIEAAMANPEFYDDQKRASEMSQEYNQVKRLVVNYDAYVKSTRELAENEELAKSDDPDMIAMAEEEIPALRKQVEKLDVEMQYALLPQDDTENRDAIIELRAGTGGDEASLFAADLLRMYTRYGEDQGWKVEVLEASPSEVGGFKEVTVKVSGEEVFRRMKYESGVHRVQRVPTTETQGRIHTSTATVAVMPEAEEVDVQLKPEELRIEVCRSGGPGGQHVIRTGGAKGRTRKRPSRFFAPSSLRSRSGKRRKNTRSTGGISSEAGGGRRKSALTTSRRGVSPTTGSGSPFTISIP
jgi:peptide chain release factor 1